MKTQTHCFQVTQDDCEHAGENCHARINDVAWLRARIADLEEDLILKDAALEDEKIKLVKYQNEVAGKMEALREIFGNAPDFTYGV